MCLIISIFHRSLVSHTIVHKALLEFFTNADEKMRTVFFLLFLLQITEKA